MREVGLNQWMFEEVKMKKISLIGLLMSIFAGCCQTLTPIEREQQMAQSKQELIRNPGSMCRLTVHRNYQEVCRIVRKDMIRSGLELEAIQITMHPDIEMAEIDILIIDRCMAMALEHIEVKALSSDTSEFVSYYWYDWKYESSHVDFCEGWRRSIEEFKE